MLHTNLYMSFIVDYSNTIANNLEYYFLGLGKINYSLFI